MNEHDISIDSLTELRSGMQTLKESLPAQNLISDKAIRKAMRSKSAWLNWVVIIEIIMIPLFAVCLYEAWQQLGMSIWLMITYVIMGIPDTILDLRTLRISRKWIQNETLVGLGKKLIRQKVERQRQTFVASFIAIPWMLWFVYEFLKHCVTDLSEESFNIVWGVVAALYLVAFFIFVLIIYRKAQQTNDELIEQIRALEEN